MVGAATAKLGGTKACADVGSRQQFSQMKAGYET